MGRGKMVVVPRAPVHPATIDVKHRHVLSALVSAAPQDIPWVFVVCLRIKLLRHAACTSSILHLLPIVRGASLPPVVHYGEYSPCQAQYFASGFLCQSLPSNCRFSGVGSCSWEGFPSHPLLFAIPLSLEKRKKVEKEKKHIQSHDPVGQVVRGHGLQGHGCC